MKKCSTSRVLSITAVIASSICIYFLFQLLLSRYHYRAGLDSLNHENLLNARESLDKALVYLPGDEEYPVFTTDLQRILTALGDLSLKKAATITAVQDYSAELKNGDAFFRSAVRLNPYDIQAATGLAAVQVARQRLYSYRHPQNKNPYNALPYFEKALELRPNGIALHYRYVSYLFSQRQEESLVEAVTALSTIYPPSYSRLKKEPLNTPAIRTAIKTGLEKAIDRETNLREAYAALSAIDLAEENLSGAIGHYQSLLDVLPEKNSARNHIEMGRLFLKSAAFEDAARQFIRALALTDNRQSTLRAIYADYRRENLNRQFLQFTRTAEENFKFTQLLDICIAQAFMELAQPELARARLIRVDSGKYAAESFYLLARIAQKEKDWDSMELAIQRATVLEPQNSNYHYLFSQVLFRQKKYPRAEAAATKAILNSIKPNQGYLNFRGLIRRSRQNYKGAIDDWKQAISIYPENGAYYYQISLTYKAQKNYSSAKKYAQKALKLDRTSEKYKNHLDGLKVASGK